MRLPFVPAAALAFALAAGSIASGATAISNLSLFNGDHFMITSSQRVAAPFTTGLSASTLEGVSLFLNASSNTGTSLQVSIYGDASGSPGSLLGTFSGASKPSSAGIYGYTISSLALSAEATYWIVASVASGSGAYSWSLTFPDTPTRDPEFSDWNLGYSRYDSGTGWRDIVIDNQTYQRMSLSATLVPEPASCVLALLGCVTLVLRRRGR